MLKIIRVVVLTLTLFGPSFQAQAAYNATVTGTVGIIQQNSPSLGGTAETVIFNVSGQPTVSCAGGTGSFFIISPTTVADAQTRKNLLALLLSAKAMGATIEVAFDSTGGWCDQNQIGVYFIEVL